MFALQTHGDRSRALPSLRTRMRPAGARVVLTLALLLALHVTTRASADIYVHDIVTGALTETIDGTSIPSGLGYDSLCDVPDRIKGFVDAANEIAVVGFFSILHAVDTESGTGTSGDPTLNGGEFGGSRLRDVLDLIVGVRTVSGSVDMQVALLGATGISTYVYLSGEPGGTTNGNFLAVRNPTLSGGDFDGLLFTDIAVGDYVGYRGLLESQIAILGPSGINYYDIVTGTQIVSPFDPVISGVEFDGLRFSQLEPENFGGFRNQASGQILLVPEPSFAHALVLAAGSLSWLRGRGRRRSLRNPSI